ncbi:MAG TPA: serine/threonine protein kinase [Rhodopirellula baltica]|uniref:Serine/threonine protein kinase n=1 Tax=Rhodopirellula baltica (strain DSM 10527 / NCIMB 13988 / SH1) TaxID=243090 RepID=Q7UZ75_RHOBA|nr:serine/threonine-protein kinase [Rhodopirellula baltica]CAD71408.1 serine/threonine protein kinase [Rhodopirellula baltica SH 1]HBE65569.1 serine/threonine protein kinase [Rhodopirellula baltica]
MNLSDLPARELARLDAVCLEYESSLRQVADGEPAPSDLTSIQSLVERHGGEHADLLRSELEAIRAEIDGDLGIHGDSGELTQVLAASNDTPSREAAALDTPAVDAMKMDDSLRSTPSAEARVKKALAKVASDGSSDSLPPLGTEIGPYRLDGVLGRGGMGVVYRATDTRLERSVAVKMLSIDGHPNLVERFQREAKAVASLTHPNIVELFDVGVHEGMPYAVMEHLRGETLMRRMESRRTDVAPITTQMVRYWGRQLAEALATSHASGVIHRDLKPENVMLVGRRSGSPTPSPANSNTISGHSIAMQSSNETSLPSVKLFDFGLSRVGRAVFGPGESDPESQHEDAGNDEANEAKTRAGMILGTPGYMAPEQARGETVTPAADVFSLGCVLFEAFYGRPAFTGKSPASRYAAVLEKTPLPDPGRRRDDIALADLIMAMMRKVPAERPTAATVVAALSSGGAILPANDGETLATPMDGASMTQPIRIAGGVSRRRFVEMIGGSFAGALVGMSGLSGNWAKLNRIRSIGVLSFTPATQVETKNEVDPQPARGRMLQRGELLAGLVANELSRLEGLSVPKYVPMTASFPDQYRDAASRLEVDALVTGTFTEATGAQPGFMDVNIQIICAESGTQIWGKVIRTSGGDNLIEQNHLARQVASAINRSLLENPHESRPRDPGAFTCLLKGRTQADPDSIDGMRSALKCFDSALSEDPNYAPAHAGKGLTSLTLAGRVADEEAQELIIQAQRSIESALELDTTNVEARLASAMLMYQRLGDLKPARDILLALSKEANNSWQVFHQLGWVQLMLYEEMAGVVSLRRAASLHSTSKLLQSDLARAQWFVANKRRAIDEATGVMPKTDGNQVGPESFTRGLLIDLYEHSSDLKLAADLDPGLNWSESDGADRYWELREARLETLPYGPYGPTLNETILQLRRTDVVTREPAEQRLARLLQTRSPMLPLLLIKHPQFDSIRTLPAAGEAFPVLRPGVV